MNAKFKKVFPGTKPLIGMVHLPAMPGYPSHPGMQVVISKALEDLERLQTAGFDGLLVENDNDQPPRAEATKEVKEAFKDVMRVVLKEARVPVGMELVYDMIASVEIAKEVGAQFVRLDVFADEVETKWGRVGASAGLIEPGEVLLLADVHVKHAKLVKPRPLENSIEDTISKGADGVIITGEWTGLEPNLRDLKIALKTCDERVPVIVGSGLNHLNAKSLFKYADGGIVGSSIKTDGRIDIAKASKIRGVVENIRHYND